MMFKEKFVVAVKHNGRVMREQGDTTYLPFGSEYTLLLKNLNSVRALVKVEIDGVDATLGTQLIVPANGSIDLERFLVAGQMDQGHRFKFIERSKKIEDGPRGIGAEDGLIRIEFEFEQQQPAIVPGPIYGPSTYLRGNPWHYDSFWNRPYCGATGTCGPTGTSTGILYGSAQNITDVKLGSSGVLRGDTPKAAFVTSAGTDSAATQTYDPKSIQEDFYFPSHATDVKAENDVGITVPGSVSDQKFTPGAWFPTDRVKHVMILKLLGQIAGQHIKEAVTVKTKQECPTCGTKNKFGTKFCKECGTGLTIV